MDLRLRPLTGDDIGAIAQVHRSACLIAYRFMDWSYSEAEICAWYAGKYRDWDWGLVAETGGAVVGFAAAIGAHLDQLFVAPDSQGRNIGSALLAAAIEHVPPVTSLHVFEQNAGARRFYERHGFRRLRRHPTGNEKAVELLYGR